MATKPADILYSASAEKVAIVEVPEMAFLLLDGTGDPNNSPRFQQIMETLFSVSYTLKFTLKKRDGLDFKVSVPEGLWWTEDMNHFSQEAKDQWLYTIMIRQPEFITSAHVAEAIDAVRAKKGPGILDELRFARFHEGLSAQILHLGPYSSEGPTIARLHEAIAAQGYTRRGKHHEIYLSDMRRVPPERWRTIVRQPIG